MNIQYPTIKIGEVQESQPTPLRVMREYPLKEYASDLFLTWTLDIPCSLLDIQSFFCFFSLTPMGATRAGDYFTASQPRPSNRGRKIPAVL